MDNERKVERPLTENPQRERIKPGETEGIRRTDG